MAKVSCIVLQVFHFHIKIEKNSTMIWFIIRLVNIAKISLVCHLPIQYWKYKRCINILVENQSCNVLLDFTPKYWSSCCCCCFSLYLSKTFDFLWPEGSHSVQSWHTWTENRLGESTFTGGQLLAACAIWTSSLAQSAQYRVNDTMTSSVERLWFLVSYLLFKPLPVYLISSFFFTRYWCVRSAGCYLSRVPFLCPSLRLCSSPPVASSPCPSPALCERRGLWTVSRGWGTLFWPLCQSMQNQPRICLKATVRRRAETRIPRVSRLEGRTFGPGRWPRSAPRWRSWSPGAQSQPAPGRSSRHLAEREHCNISSVACVERGAERRWGALYDAPELDRGTSSNSPWTCSASHLSSLEGPFLQT